MSLAIKAENISKAYQLGEFSTGTLSRDIERAWYRMRGKEDPFLKIGETNDRTLKGDSDIVWSLKDINFEINQGDAVGIIGRNGAGKSTLLKVLSRVTTPTSGIIRIKGRIASLLEVGTGFHPELTGRENIFLNGAILGMKKKEITRKFDEIVDFAGVDRYVDTPVKRYSSGMYVRLAFAVAAYLEPDTLIVDEVLAVGDAEFQKKALGKMEQVSQGEGRTVLFVSHNINAIYSLTRKCIFLQNGRLVQMGPTAEIVQLYQNASGENLGKNNSFQKDFLDEQKPIEMTKANLFRKPEGILEVVVDYIVRRRVESVVSIRINNMEGVPMLTLRDTDSDPDTFIKYSGSYSFCFSIPISIFADNIYKITFSFSDMKTERFDFYEDLLSFEVDDLKENSNFVAKREGVLNFGISNQKKLK